MTSIATSTANRSVGRPREFDEDQVLDQVMELFWRKGYEGTSLADLLKATGLHKGSLYQAFGDKHSVFMLAIRRYLQHMSQRMSAIMNGHELAVEGLRDIMHHGVDMSCSGGDCNRGCLVFNTIADMGKDDDEVHRLLQKARTVRLKMIAQTVQRAQEQGGLRNDLSADRIAGMLDILIAGLSVSLKGAMPTAQAHQMVDDLIEALAP